jgi:hypothetical protein
LTQTDKLDRMCYGEAYGIISLSCIRNKKGAILRQLLMIIVKG